MADDPGIAIAVDGEEYILVWSSLTATEVGDFRREVGITLREVMSNDIEDLDTIAGLLWLIRKRTEPGLTYRSVADNFTMGTKYEFRPPVEPDTDESVAADPLADPEV